MHNDIRSRVVETSYCSPLRSTPVDRHFLEVVKFANQQLSDRQCHHALGLQLFILEGWSKLANGAIYRTFPCMYLEANRIGCVALLVEIEGVRAIQSRLLALTSPLSTLE